MLGDQLEIRIADDGCGIDAAKLNVITNELGLPPPKNAADLAAIVVHVGVSTSSSVDQDKERGVGSAAAKQSITELGGSINLNSPQRDNFHDFDSL